MSIDDLESSAEMQDGKNEEERLRDAALGETRRAVLGVLDECQRHDEMIEGLVRSAHFQEVVARVRAHDAARAAGADEIDLKAPVSADEPQAPRRSGLAGQLQNFIRTLNQETEEGYTSVTALLQVPVSEWDAVLRENPTWVRHGTFDYLIREAEERRESGDAARAHEIMTFVLGHVGSVPTPLHGKILGDSLPGRAWLEHAETLFALGDIEGAEAAAQWADGLLEENPMLFVDRASVQLLRARILAASGHASDALVMLSACVRVFVDNTHPREAVQALGCMAEILSRAKKWRDVRDVLKTARRVTARLDHQPTLRMLAEIVDRCTTLGFEDAETPTIVPFTGDWTTEQHDEDTH